MSNPHRRWPVWREVSTTADLRRKYNKGAADDDPNDPEDNPSDPFDNPTAEASSKPKTSMLAHLLMSDLKTLQDLHLLL